MGIGGSFKRVQKEGKGVFHTPMWALQKKKAKIWQHLSTVDFNRLILLFMDEVKFQSHEAYLCSSPFIWCENGGSPDICDTIGRCIARTVYMATSASFYVLSY